MEICKGKKKIYTLLFGHWNIHLRKGLIHLSQDEQRERHLTCKRQNQQINIKPHHLIPNMRLFSFPSECFIRDVLTFVKEEPTVENRTKVTTLKVVSSMILLPRIPVPGELDLRHSHSIWLTSSGSDKSSAKFPTHVPNFPELSYCKSLSS